MNLLYLIIILTVTFNVAVCNSNECDTNLQTRTYTSHHHPLRFNDSSFAIAPFFSPDSSLSTEQSVIANAKESIDISIPYWQSWSGCSVGGCSPDKLRNNESFALWAPLLNAIYRGVRVHVLTSPCSNSPTPPSLIDPLSFLVLAGAEVRYYTQTAHLHAKLMMVDDDITLISSVNFSPTSFIHNREAGFVFHDPPQSSSEIGKYVRAVFEEDWETGAPITIDNFDSNVWSFARDTSLIDPPLAISGNYSDCGYYTTPVEHHVVNVSGVIRVSPDWSFDTLMEQLDSVKESIWISIYEVSQVEVCEKLLELHQKGIDVRLLVSNDLYGEALKKRANACYLKLHNGGLVTRLTAANCYTFSHQKYWIVDNATVTLSTGNWDEKDDPKSETHVYPPPSSPQFQAAFRDVHVTLDNAFDVKDVMLDVLEGDWRSGHDWKQ